MWVDAGVLCHGRHSCIWTLPWEPEMTCPSNSVLHWRGLGDWKLWITHQTQALMLSWCGDGHCSDRHHAAVKFAYLRTRTAGHNGPLPAHEELETQRSCPQWSVGVLGNGVGTLHLTIHLLHKGFMQSNVHSRYLGIKYISHIIKESDCLNTVTTTDEKNFINLQRENIWWNQ